MGVNCRACLEGDFATDEAHPLDDESTRRSFEECCKIQLHPEEYHLWHLCNLCALHCEQWSNFKHQVSETNRLFLLFSLKKNGDGNDKDLCRGCLSAVDPASESPSLREEAIGELFKECTAIEVRLEDATSHHKLCGYCYEKCLQWRDFRNLSLESDHKLKSSSHDRKEITQYEIVEVKEEVLDYYEDAKEDYKVELLDIVDDLKEEPLNGDQYEEVEVEANEIEHGGWLVFDMDIVKHESSVEEVNEEIPVQLGVVDRPMEEQIKQDLESDSPDDEDEEVDVGFDLNPDKDEDFKEFESTDTETDKSDRISQSEVKAKKKNVIKVACDICGKHFNKWYLQLHMQFHYGEKTFLCDKCPKSFYTNEHLTKHLRCHTGEKPFPCGKCKKAFADRSTLLNHRRLHTGEKPYQCKDCDSAFSQIAALINHQRTHTGEKPFVCTEKGCKASYGDRSSLLSHKMIHTGERRFECKKCDIKYFRSSNLRRHLKSKSHKNRK